MQWQPLTSREQLDSILAGNTPAAVFKHSTRCSISSMAKNRIERSDIPPISFYYLDLLSYRQVSDYIEQKLKITHQSPQLIVVKDNKVIYHASHNSIDIQDVNLALAK